MGGIAALFTIAEQAASAETKSAVTRWLRNADPGEAVAGLPGTFAQVFDSVFGKKHLSWRCFYRSCIASVLAVALVTLFWSALHPQWRLIITRGGKDDVKFLFALIFALTILINLLPDYLSLLESRYMIYRMTRL